MHTQHAKKKKTDEETDMYRGHCIHFVVCQYYTRCHHPNIIKIYWLILEDEPLEKYFT